MSVNEVVAGRARAALAVLTELTPAAGRSQDGLQVPLDWFRWLDSGLHLLDERHFPDTGPDGPGMWHLLTAEDKDELNPSLRLERSFGERLAAVQQLRNGAHSLQIGWLWVAGSTTVTSRTGQQRRRRVFTPLVTRSVRVVRSPERLGWELLAYADVRLTELVADPAVARQLESGIETGGGGFRRLDKLTPEVLARSPRLKAFAVRAASAAGLPATKLTADRDQPEQLMRRDELRIVAGLGIYALEDMVSHGRAASLSLWSAGSLSEPTAFHSLYAGAPNDPDHPDNPDPAAVGSPEHAVGYGEVEATLPLSVRQAEIVARARTASLTVVSGAPGTGKSHTLVAVVCDALGQGSSVLMTARSEAAVDALLSLLSRQPGITPVVFGSSERRTQLAQRLANGELGPASPNHLRAAEAALQEARVARDQARQRARATLSAAWRDSTEGVAELAGARLAAPVAFGPGAAGLAELVARIDQPRGGWWARRRRRKAERALRRIVGAPPDVPTPVVLAAIEVAWARHAAPPEQSTTQAGAELLDAESALERALSTWLGLEIRSPRRLDRAGLAAVAALATALRSGRAARRAQLEQLRGRTLSDALPVWVGTLGDVDDLLPPVPGLFDLVLVDEAASTEQTVACSSLLRARRAVIVGDPRQLRHVSFLADRTIEEVADRHQIEPGPARSQLDVRRNSLFDAAAAVSPVIALDEHFRSAPHLIDVVARTLYQGRFHVATRTPVSEMVDCVHLQPGEGTARPGGVVEAEVQAVLSLLRDIRGTARSVGVITPFRAQADRLEQAVLGAFDADELIRMGVRVGTVHGFQGHERDRVICSLGLIEDDPAGWSFVADPHLLAVLLTRARHSMTIVCSCRPDPASMLGQYLAAADTPPGRPAPAAVLQPWARAIVDEIRQAGFDVTSAYPAGRHLLDGAVVVHGIPVGLICTLHPDGVDAHLQRHLALRRAGWHTLDALEADWSDRRGELIVDLLEQLRRGPG
ncbi:MAG: DEAD/DEAH box helicase [Acidimicrobiales bacterium]